MPHYRSPRAAMILVERATPQDRAEVERLLAEYATSEGITPKKERITWAVEQQLRSRFPGVLLVAREKGSTLGVALAVYLPSAQLGRTLVIQDFYVVPSARRKGVGRALAARIFEEAKAMRIDRVDLEILPMNTAAAAFWKSMGFRTLGRTVYSRDLA